MKKPVKIILIVAACLVGLMIAGLGLLYWWVGRSDIDDFRINTTPPPRPASVPATAIWRGGLDGGFWFVLKDVDTVSKRYHFNVYNDYEGLLEVDAYFQKDTPCNAIIPLDTSLLQVINYFDLEHIVMDNNCRLNIMYPVLSGSLAKDMNRLKEESGKANDTASANKNNNESIDYNQAVFTVRSVINRTSPILSVVHDDEGEWQFLDGRHVSMSEVKLVSLAQIIKIDTSVNQVVNMKKGYQATRQNATAAWSVAKAR